MRFSGIEQDLVQICNAGHLVGRLKLFSTCRSNKVFRHYNGISQDFIGFFAAFNAMYVFQWIQWKQHRRVKHGYWSWEILYNWEILKRNDINHFIFGQTPTRSHRQDERTKKKLFDSSPNLGFHIH